MQPALPPANSAQKPPSKRSMWIIILCGAYLLMPGDLLPDIIPFLGTFDDLGAFFLAVRTAVDFKKAQP